MRDIIAHLVAQIVRRGIGEYILQFVRLHDFSAIGGQAVADNRDIAVALIGAECRHWAHHQRIACPKLICRAMERHEQRHALAIMRRTFFDIDQLIARVCLERVLRFRKIFLIDRDRSAEIHATEWREAGTFRLRLCDDIRNDPANRGNEFAHKVERCAIRRNRKFIEARTAIFVCAKFARIREREEFIEALRELLFAVIALGLKFALRALEVEHEAIIIFLKRIKFRVAQAIFRRFASRAILRACCLFVLVAHAVAADRLINDGLRIAVIHAIRLVFVFIAGAIAAIRAAVCQAVQACLANIARAVAAIALAFAVRRAEFRVLVRVACAITAKTLALAVRRACLERLISVANAIAAFRNDRAVIRAIRRILAFFAHAIAAQIQDRLAFAVRRAISIILGWVTKTIATYFYRFRRLMANLFV